jgi:hypothetical protein
VTVTVLGLAVTLTVRVVFVVALTVSVVMTGGSGTHATGGSTSATVAAYAQGGPNESSDTPVTGDELAKVTAAVKAKDSSVTVTSVRKDPDGSYDVFGSTSGSQVMYDVSADLGTITQNSVSPGQRSGSQSNSSDSATPSATA